MDDFFPATLPPVHYFLKEINTPAWLAAFRICFGVVLLGTAILYIVYRVKHRRRENESGRTTNPRAEEK